MKKNLGALMTLAVLALPGIALASLGGPDVAEFLGWSPRDERAYFAIHHFNESGNPASVYYMDLKAPRPGRLIRVGWSRAEGPPDSTYRVGWRSLTRRLVKLPLEPAPAIPSRPAVERLDSLSTRFGSWARYRVRISVNRSFDGIVEVTTIRDSSVSVIQTYAIPGRRERLGILAFIGIPNEDGYEAQVPFIIPESRDTLRIEWKRDYE